MTIQSPFFVLLLLALSSCAEKREKPEVAQPPSIEKPVSSSIRDSIVDFAQELAGTPYVAAGCSRDGFDC